MTGYFTRFPISYLMEDVKKKHGVNHKFYLIYHLIDRHRDKENNSWLTIKNVSDFCGVKYTKRESNCFREVLDVLDFMTENQMIFIRQDIRKCTFDTCIEITINQINYDPDKKFLKLFYKDVDWIRNYRSSIKKEKLLRVYLHMLYFIGARPRDSQGNELGENPQAFPEAYFGSIDNMAKNSLNALSQEALTEEEQKKIKWTVIKGSITISCLLVGLIYNVLFLLYYIYIYW